MFVPREKNINVIEESFVLLKPDVAESHGILIDAFTSSGFSVSAKKIPRSKEIIESIVKHFPTREVGAHASSHHRSGRFARSLYPKDSFTSLGGRLPSSSKLNREDSLAADSTARKSPKNEEDDDDEDDAARFSRMRQHRSALTRGTLDDSPMQHFMGGSNVGGTPGGASSNATPGGRRKGTDARIAPSWETHGNKKKSDSKNNNNNHSEEHDDLEIEDFTFRSNAQSSPYSSRHSYLWGHNENEEDRIPSYGDHLKFILQGTCMALVVSAANAVEAAKLLCGPESPKEAKEHYPNSIRAQFGTTKLKNAVFCAPTHDIASELIDAVFGYKTEQRTEVVRFSNQLQQQQQNRDLYSHVDEMTLQELEEAEADVVSAALDAAVFGADVAPLPNSAMSEDDSNNNNNNKNPSGTIANANIKVQAAGTGGVARESSGGIGSSNRNPESTSATTSEAPSSQQQTSLVPLSSQQQMERSGGGGQTSMMNRMATPQQSQALLEIQRQSNILRAREIDLMIREKSLAESSWMFRGDGVKVADPPRTGKELFGSPGVHQQQQQLGSPLLGNNQNRRHQPRPPSTTGDNNKDGGENTNNNNATSNNNTNNVSSPLLGNRRLGQHASWTTITHPNSRVDTHMIRFIDEDKLDEYVENHPGAKLLKQSVNGTNSNSTNLNNSNNNNNSFSDNGSFGDDPNRHHSHVVLPLLSRSHRGMTSSSSPQPAARKSSMHPTSSANPHQFDENNTTNNANQEDQQHNANQQQHPGMMMLDEKYDKDLQIIQQNAASGKLTHYQIQQQQRLRGYHTSNDTHSHHHANSNTTTPQNINLLMNEDGTASSSFPSLHQNAMTQNYNNSNHHQSTPGRSNHLGVPSSYHNLTASPGTINNNNMSHPRGGSAGRGGNSPSSQQQHHHHINPFIDQSVSSSFGFKSEAAPKPPKPISAVLDPSLVFECGSNNLKLKNLFERFEKLARDRKEAVFEFRKKLIAVQLAKHAPANSNKKNLNSRSPGDAKKNHAGGGDDDQQIYYQLQQQLDALIAQESNSPATGLHPKYGRLIPKSEFVEFVREAVKHDCIDTDNPELLIKPILQYMDSVCGRGGAEWVTFDEFVIVLMKVMQT